MCGITKAQSQIDTSLIFSAEDKWRRASNLLLGSQQKPWVVDPESKDDESRQESKSNEREEEDQYRLEARVPLLFSEELSNRIGNAMAGMMVCGGEFQGLHPGARVSIEEGPGGIIIGQKPGTALYYVAVSPEADENSSSSSQCRLVEQSQLTPRAPSLQGLRSMLEEIVPIMMKEVGSILRVPLPNQVLCAALGSLPGRMAAFEVTVLDLQARFLLTYRAARVAHALGSELLLPLVNKTSEESTLIAAFRGCEVSRLPMVSAFSKVSLTRLQAHLVPMLMALQEAPGLPALGPDITVAQLRAITARLGIKGDLSSPLDAEQLVSVVPGSDTKEGSEEPRRPSASTAPTLELGNTIAPQDALPPVSLTSHLLEEAQQTIHTSNATDATSISSSSSSSMLGGGLFDTESSHDEPPQAEASRTVTFADIATQGVWSEEDEKEVPSRFTMLSALVDPAMRAKLAMGSKDRPLQVRRIQPH